MILKQILTMVAVLSLLSSAALAAASTGIVTRSFSAASVLPNGNVTVTLTPSPSTLFNSPGYQIVETIPAGLTLISYTAALATPVGNVYTFIQIGSSPVTYVVAAPGSEGTYTFSGTFKDADTNTGTVSGSSALIVSGSSAGDVTRAFSAHRVSPGGNITVTLSPSPESLFTSPGYQVTETIPAGFTFVSTPVFGNTNVGNVYTLTQVGSSPITYVVKAPAVAGNYSFSGSFKDQLNAAGQVSGSSTVSVENVVAEYAGADNRVDRNDALHAIVDFFGGVITRDDALSILIRFFAGS